ncbi:MAG: DOMON-like domain-containing protein, partial [Candidatus Binatia bacterium]
RRTCFESFLAADGITGYHELNFSPSREWTLYEFRGYRDGGPVADEYRAPEIDVRTGTRHLELDARISLDRLSPAHASADLRVGLAAVVEANDGTMSYWAIQHPAGKPDFHHADGFALWLGPPGSDTNSPTR